MNKWSVKKEREGEVGGNKEEMLEGQGKRKNFIQGDNWRQKEEFTK